MEARALKFDPRSLRFTGIIGTGGNMTTDNSASEPVNTLIWQYEFPDIETAYKTLDFFSGDEGHEMLFRQQVKFMKTVKIEFYKTLDFVD